MSDIGLYKKILLLCTGIMVFLSSILFIFFINFYRQEITAYEYELIRSEINDTAIRTNRMLLDYMHLVNLIINDQGVMELYTREFAHALVYHEALSRYVGGSDGVNAIALVTSRGNVFFSMQHMANSTGIRDVYLHYANNNGFARQMVWISSHAPEYAINTNFKVIKLLHDIFDDSFNYMGTLIINIRDDLLADVERLNDYAENAFILIDTGGRVLLERSGIEVQTAERQLQEILRIYNAAISYDGNFTETLEGTTFITVYQKLLNFQMFMVGIVSTAPMNRKIRSFIINMTGILLLIYIPCIIVSVLICGSIYRPVKKLVSAMGTVEKGNLDVSLTVSRSAEMEYLADGFNNMTARIKLLIEENNRNSLLAKDLEIKALQSQITPHLLYNTLGSIIWLLENNEKDRAIAIISKLGKYYRFSLSKKDSLIELEMELEHLKLYMDIERYRLNNAFSYTIDIPGELLDFKCPRVFLQPVIENSIIHGIKGKEGESIIVIKVKKRRGAVIIQIADSGKGMNKERLQVLNTALTGGDDDISGNSYGIYNIRSRIILTYGQGSGIHYLSKQGIGTMAVLRLTGRD